MPESNLEKQMALASILESNSKTVFFILMATMMDCRYSIFWKMPGTVDPYKARFCRGTHHQCLPLQLRISSSLLR